MLKANKSKSILILIPIVVTMLFAFNNCGNPNKESFNGAGTSSSSKTPDTNQPSDSPFETDEPVETTPLPPVPKFFQAGDDLSKEELMKISANLGNFFEAYSAEKTKPKAMAVTWDGVGSVGLYGFSQDAAGLSSHVISLCNARFQKLCLLLASGDKFTVSHQDLEDAKASGGTKGTGSSIVQGQTIDAATFPFLRGHQTIQDYLSNPNVKAIAASWSGGLVWQATGSAPLSQEEMSRMTLESCQLITLKKCVLLAEGNSYVWNWRSKLMAWTLPAAGDALDLAKLPIVANQYRKDASASVYSSQIASGGHGAIYLVQGGGAAMRVSATDSMDLVKADGLKTCEATYPGKTCYLYAVDNTVVWEIAEKK